MKKRKGHLREFEKNNRTINIEQAQTIRRERLEEQKRKQNIKKKKKGSKQMNYIKAASLVAVVGILIFFIISTIKIVQLEQEKKEHMQRQEELVQEKEILEMKLDNTNEESYMEGQARKDLKLVKPNELLFIFQEEDADE